ncbi:hypothetical protein ABZ532_13810 [Streptomyces sp. NPDC019396]|uniref:hypothetical protein n=1 Tax=Streptomyces sp. NPDC019396 TaxID=3154687 RepID=UPI0034076476
MQRPDDLGAVGVVVLCVEPPDTGVARAGLDCAIRLVDVGATQRLLEGVAALQDIAARTGATGVLSAAVASGLTNHLARRAHEAVIGTCRCASHGRCRLSPRRPRSA